MKLSSLLPLLSSFIFLMAMTACSSRPVETDVVGATAKQYYDYLIEGNYDAFVDGQYHSDSIPPQYREQLVANAKMFVAQQKSEHHGLHEVKIKTTKINKKAHTAEAFLVFVYGDSTTEEVLVPMTEHDNLWYMK